MKVLIIHNTCIPVKGYGGVERIIWWMGKELCRLGHKVVYLVPEGSECPFADILVFESDRPINDQIPNDVDIVHLCFQTKEKVNKPYLMMYQYYYHPEEKFDVNTVFISKNQAERNRSTTYVYNGIDPDEYGPVDFDAQRRHLLFLGYAKRPEKNLKDCLKIARKTKNVLAVVGGKDKWYRRRPWVRYKGIIGGAEKNKVLQSSKALLFPVRWHEPFGIAIIEALYFGCPVIGSRYGALVELVPDDVGFLSNVVSELIEAVKNLNQFDPKRCHEYVCDQFTVKHMTDNYLKLYEKVLAGENLNPTEPINGGNFSREELLPLN